MVRVLCPLTDPGRTGWKWNQPLEEGWSLERVEQEYIIAVLQRTGGHRTRAAAILGIDRRTLYRKIQRASREYRGWALVDH